MTDIDSNTRLEGATDSTQIGNRGDALKVAQTAAAIDTGNSSSTPLGSNAIFTGSWVDVLDHTNVSIMVYSDVASATDGLAFQQSSDGTNVDDEDKYTIAAATGKQYTFGVAARYVRVKYTNGGSAQAVFRLQTLHHTFAPKPSSHRIDDTPTTQDDAELVKAIISGKSSSGSNYVNVKATPSGALVTATTIDTAQSPYAPASDTLTSASDTVVFDNSVIGYGAIGVVVTGTWVGTITFQASVDGSTYNTQTVLAADGTIATTTAANGQWFLNLGGIKSFRLNMTAYTSGTATVQFFATGTKAPYDVGTVRQPSSTTWIVREDDHNRIHQGTSYSWSDDFTMSSGTTRYYEIVSDTKTAHALFGIITNGEVELYLFEGATVTTTTDVYSYKNRNRSSANTTGYTLKLATVVSVEGTELFDFHMGLSTGSATSVQLQRGQEWILKVSTTYLLKVVSGSNNNDITLMVDFYHTS